MDTDDRYLDAVLRWDYPPTHTETLPGTDVPVDGFVEFRYPRYQDDQPDRFDPYESGYYWRHSFPFRSREKNDAPWFGNPDGGEWSRRPIWKWQNPNDPIENATLSPSIGMRGDDGIDFHCYIRNGRIDWL